MLGGETLVCVGRNDPTAKCDSKGSDNNSHCVRNVLDIWVSSGTNPCVTRLTLFLVCVVPILMVHRLPEQGRNSFRESAFSHCFAFREACHACLHLSETVFLVKSFFAR